MRQMGPRGWVGAARGADEFKAIIRAGRGSDRKTEGVAGPQVLPGLERSCIVGVHLDEQRVLRPAQGQFDFCARCVVHGIEDEDMVSRLGPIGG